MVPGFPTHKSWPRLYLYPFPRHWCYLGCPSLESPESRWVWLLELAETSLNHKLLKANPSPFQCFSSKTQVVTVLPYVLGRASLQAALCLLHCLAGGFLISAPHCPSPYPVANIKPQDGGGSW